MLISIHLVYLKLGCCSAHVVMLEILYNRHTKVLNNNVKEISKFSIVMNAVKCSDKKDAFTSFARSITSILLIRVCVCVL